LKNITRKTALQQLALGLVAFPQLVKNGNGLDRKENLQEALESIPWKGNINHSVCYWIYSEIPLEDFCKALQKIGIHTIDLIGPKDWPLLKKLGMNLGIANGAEIGLNEGFNHVQYHDTLIKNYSEIIPQLASFGYDNLICFSGQRKGISEEEGIENCVKGLEKLILLAEKHKVTLTMELLNSKVDHPDYQCDHTAFGVEICKRLNSPNIKLLYDIYHMQIMEGNLIHTIEKNYPFISHYHTGGVPGRHDIDETQEIYYPAVMEAIVKTGYKGSVAQEFIPSSKDKMEALVKAFKICDV
jgi:hydroxypyruvate isomerase